MNKQNYNYSAIILIIELAPELKIEYKNIIKIFDKVFVVDSIESSYATYDLSKYMLENGDFINSRKMAALSLRYSENNPFLNTYQQNFDKASWFFYNAARISSTFQYSTEK
jgi:hypothetical protein